MSAASPAEAAPAAPAAAALAAAAPAPAAAAPSAAAEPVVPGQLPAGHSMLQEGSAKIIYNTQNKVFYNKVQVFNRDLSILVSKMFLEQRKAEEMDRAARRAARAACGTVLPCGRHRGLRRAAHLLLIVVMRRA